MMEETFDDPILTIDRQDKYSGREVGITHPDVPGFVRIRDNGDIEIVASEGLAILMHPRTGTMTFVADHINFMTRHENGLCWNHVAFNDKATHFKEPTFISRGDMSQETFHLYEGIEIFYDDDEEGNQVAWVTDELGNKMTFEEYAKLNERDREPESPWDIPEYDWDNMPPGT